MQQKIGADLAVGGDQRAHGFGMRGGFLPRGSCRDHGFEVDFVGVEQQADERHLVVGFVAHVGDDDGARVAGEIVDVRWRKLRAERSGAPLARLRAR